MSTPKNNPASPGQSSGRGQGPSPAAAPAQNTNPPSATATPTSPPPGAAGTSAPAAPPAAPPPVIGRSIGGEAPAAPSAAEMANRALAKASKTGTMAGLKATDIGQVLNSLKGQIVSALPKHLTADRMIQMASTLIGQNPKIAECSAGSLVGAVMQASILGFEPVAALGQCYFVPYGGHVQFQIGYRGYVKLAQNSKELKNIYAEVVREGDTFEYELGLMPKLRHVPNVSGDGTEKITHVYAVAHLNNGGYQFIVLTRKQVELLRLRNPMQAKSVQPSGAWATDYDEMAKAKSIKKLSKYLPLSVDMMKAVASDEAIIDTKVFAADGTGVNVDMLQYDSYEVVSSGADTTEPVKQPEPPAQTEAAPTDGKLFNS